MVPVIKDDGTKEEEREKSTKDRQTERGGGEGEEKGVMMMHKDR